MMSGNDVRIRVRVTPKAKKNELLGWQEGVLRVKVAAVPQDGRANAALEAFLADLLGVARSRIKVVTGHASRNKVVAIEGIAEADVSRVLGRN